MADGGIADDQISMTNSVEGSYSKPRLNSDGTWCGTYILGEVAVRINFKSVVKIVGVYFGGNAGGYKATKGWFHYFSAEENDNAVKRKVCHSSIDALVDTTHAHTRTRAHAHTHA